MDFDQDDDALTDAEWRDWMDQCALDAEINARIDARIEESLFRNMRARLAAEGLL